MSDESSCAKRTRWTYDEPCTQMQLSPVNAPNITGSFQAAELTIIAMYSETQSLPPLLSQEVKTSLWQLAKDDNFTFKNGSQLSAMTPTIWIVDNAKVLKRYALVGLGPKQKSSSTDGFSLGATIARRCDEEKGCRSCLVLLPKDFLGLTELVTSFRVKLHRDTRYRTGDNVQVPAQNLTNLYVIPDDSPTSIFADFQQHLFRGTALATAQILAMDIVNAPHNVLNSASFANLARDLESSTLSCQILDKAACEKRGMGAYLAVARGSETEPMFIHLTYKGSSIGGKPCRKIGIVGKGVMMDTGGYNIKLSSMELMKFDCAGAAAVLGAAKVIDKLQPRGVEVHFIVAACENMISSKAYVPGDVVTASNGMTIEVVDTDMEGRLTLADALVYADKEVGCERIIELSTLTGSCMVSLGKKVCGIWTENDGLAKELEVVSQVIDEQSWRMPLVREYSDQLKSQIADLKNGGTRYGGAITAALFLSNFVSNDKAFVHIDMAGPAWDDKTGATGFGVKLVTEWICRFGSSS